MELAPKNSRTITVTYYFTAFTVAKENGAAATGSSVLAFDVLGDRVGASVLATPARRGSRPARAFFHGPARHLRAPVAGDCPRRVTGMEILRLRKSSPLSLKDF
ncbi:hypothetical protein [Streptomyces azureus]|uniref:ATPase-like protein n=1 Tax=Streptomyces azureus TaxID=146537 RepID=A0A0K8PZW9_STRAJ|nr:hypothetical protein [Streptomyces azureus]GAP53009.1 ATPase-like protein [Streptomyces azureus]